ncbi:FAD-binding domain-containing protein [Annulohypoxylon truncatum]|uniref:FAD-binding domain-containing protein n=1 Tax=Annulohypoxylon truncatum TaxID=327061 RepID=UPI00200777D6|nr:FAD-binding domain-containing protein [Annulohypoxylon truncatum]KAI1211317.1 FAD-binding domain-containing protein [Annulohypoxylon truncatum]
MERHRQAVRLVSAAVRAYFERSEPYRIFHGSTNSTRPAHQKAGARLVDISGLRDVLSVDAARRTALVEPNVPMDRLVERTLAHGLVPPVVMEFPGITAGGGFAGTAGESSSFRHGYFDENVRGVEIVLPDGEVVFARPGKEDEDGGEYADLFKGAAGALGTLGVATLLELRLIEAKRFVRTTYRRTSSVAEAVRVVREECERDRGNDYVDGILFSKDHGVVVSGKLTNELPDDEKVQTFSGAWDPWFYMHVRERTAALPSSASATPKEGSVTEYIPLAEYLFRYDRGGFWVGQAAFDYFRQVPFNRFFRWFLDDFLHTRMLYRALHGSGESGRFVVQDVGLPYEAAEPFVDYVSEHLGIWPLWLCPLKTPAGPSFHPHLRSASDLPDGDGNSNSYSNSNSRSSSSQGKKGEGQMLNIGVWGWGPKDGDAFVRANRDLERRVDELGGMKWLYAHTYYSEPEFWRAYGGHRARYEALRERYRAESLPSVYDKVRVKVDPKGEKDWKSRVKATWPFGGLVGIWKGIKSRDYLLHRRAAWKWSGGAGEKEKLA